MFVVDYLILIASVLLLLGIASSKFSARMGVPVLVLFLALGMLAGSEGIGGIEFEDYKLAHGIGTIALAVILFDGGLSTPIAGVRSAWKPASVLATVGVLVTAGLTGLAAAWILDVPLLLGLLLGSIVGSTDAAAVFAVLRSGGVHLRRRLSSTLEIESGSNDPMAIFLTVGLIEVLVGNMELGPGLLLLFVTQMVVGTLVGLVSGYLSVFVVNRINLDAAGLYPILVGGCGLFTFGLAATLGGSGFLAIYLAGIVIGNRPLVFKRGIFLFHDAGAWLGQIVMFVVLGLLVFPTRLASVAGQGLLISAVLLLVARPLAVLVSVWWFRFTWRELLFISWVGLKGAVPITLATFPLLQQVEGAELLFNVVFFVVLVSALIQGWSLPHVARLLDVETPACPQPPVTLELSSLRHIEGDIVDFAISEKSRAAGRLVRDLALPDGVVIALIARQQKIIPPQGSTRIEAGDHVILVLVPGTRPLVSNVFADRGDTTASVSAPLEFPLKASVTIAELNELYGLQIEGTGTIDETIRRILGVNKTALNKSVILGRIKLYIRKLAADGTIERVGMIVLPELPPAKVAATTMTPVATCASDDEGE